MAKQQAARMIYRRNPLVNVVCQIRFPAILRISSESPSAFQEAIRHQYPIFGTSQNNGAYHFFSEDQNWQLVLEKDSVTLNARRYDRWETFQSLLEGPLKAFCQHYQPSFFSRVGLQYRNIIRRSSLNIQTKDWGKVLNPQATGALAWSDYPGELTGTRNEAWLRLNGNGSRLRVNHGLVTIRETNEGCYLIDNDFFIESKTEIGDALNKLETLHEEAGKVFRWWITDTLHQAMGPEAA